jgi:FkbM family methyltransferase
VIRGAVWTRARTFLLRIFFRTFSLLGDERRALADFWRAHHLNAREIELTHLDRIIGMFAIDTTRVAVDIGANYGVWSRALTLRFSDVIAIEPIPAIADMLKKRLTATVVQTAISDRAGSVQLWIPYTATNVLTGWASLNADNCPAATGTRCITVQTRTLNEVLKDRSPSFMKIDVEGHECEVLSGAAEVIRRANPLIVCEIKMPNVERVRGLMEGFGYSLVPSQEVLNVETSSEMFFLIPANSKRSQCDKARSAG